MLLEHVNCDLCGNPGYRVRYRKPDNWLRGSLFEFPVVECDNCGLVYVNPRPTPAAMASFYSSDYHENRDGPEFRKRYAAQKARLPNLTGLRVLDIGCARGDFLSYLLDSSLAFEAHGLDAFSPAVDDSRICFRRGIFNHTDYPDEYFDLVMGWAVFEHVHTPTDYFMEASRLLRPGGQLVIQVTNANSCYGRYAYTEDVPRHTYHYTERTLAAFGTKAGLSLQRVEFDDEIFDGRGRGTFRRQLGRLAGVTWEREMRNEVNLLQKVVMKCGGALDGLVFSAHWEAQLRRSGNMVGYYEKR